MYVPVRPTPALQTRAQPVKYVLRSCGLRSSSHDTLRRHGLVAGREPPECLRRDLRLLGLQFDFLPEENAKQAKNTTLFLLTRATSTCSHLLLSSHTGPKNKLPVQLRDSPDDKIVKKHSGPKEKGFTRVPCVHPVEQCT